MVQTYPHNGIKRTPVRFKCKDFGMNCINPVTNCKIKKETCGRFLFEIEYVVYATRFLRPPA